MGETKRRRWDSEIQGGVFSRTESRIYSGEGGRLKRKKKRVGGCKGRGLNVEVRLAVV